MLNIYIGKDVIKLVKGMGNKKKLTIDKSIIASLPDARFSFEEGELQHVQEKLTEMLENEKIKDTQVTFVVDNTSIIMREMDIPMGKDDEVEKMIRVQMEQILQNIDEYVLDYQVNSEETTEDSSYYKMLVVAYKKAYVETYKTLAKAFKWTIKCIDITPNCVSKLIGLYGEELGDAPYILLDIEDSHINVYLFQEGKRLLLRTINVGGSLSDGADDVDNSFKINDIVNNVSRIIQYQSSRSAVERVSRIYLTGNITDVLAIQKNMMTSFHLDVDILPNVDSIKADETFDLRKFSNMLGALVRE